MNYKIDGFHVRRTVCVLAIVAPCLVLAAGCGSRRPETVSVRGKVAFGGGAWPKAGNICFLPMKPAAGFTSRPAVASFDTDGQFIVGTFTKTDGLMPGSYQVRVECWEVPPEMGGQPAKSYLPQAYRTPHWTLDIKPGDKPINLSYEVPRGK